MDAHDVPYLCRGYFFDSVDRLLEEKVDVMIGNHSWHNHTPEKYEKMATGVAILRIFYDILNVFISLETLFQSI